MTDTGNKPRRVYPFVYYSSLIVEGANGIILSELKRHGIEDILPCHGDLLQVLLSTERISVSDLAQRTRRTKSTVSVLVEKLVKAGYVCKEKSTEDSRVTFVRLTEKGKSLEAVMQAVSVTLNDKLTAPLTQEEAAALEVLLEKVVRAVKE